MSNEENNSDNLIIGNQENNSDYLIMSNGVVSHNDETFSDRLNDVEYNKLRTAFGGER